GFRGTGLRCDRRNSACDGVSGARCEEQGPGIDLRSPRGKLLHLRGSDGPLRRFAPSCRIPRYCAAWDLIAGKTTSFDMTPFRYDSSPDPNPSETPWFWSDQFDTKLQMAEIARTGDHAVVRGSIASRKFSVFHLLDGAVCAVEAVNSAPEYMVGRKLISAGARISLERLANEGVPIKSLLQP